MRNVGHNPAANWRKTRPESLSNSPRTARAAPDCGSNRSNPWPLFMLFSYVYKSHVTKCTGNRILGAIFVLATDESRKAPLYVWMTRTCSA